MTRSLERGLKKIALPESRLKEQMFIVRALAQPLAELTLEEPV